MHLNKGLFKLYYEGGGDEYYTARPKNFASQFGLSRPFGLLPV
jgi:hypothetical protein